VHRKNSHGNCLTTIVLKANEELQPLHEEIINKLGQYLGRGITKDMKVFPEEIDSRTDHRIDHFLSDHRKENFSPHITVGFGIPSRTVAMELPLALQASPPAIYLLEKHYTCQKAFLKKSFEG